MVNFPDAGFIGSGHTENGDEEVDSLKLLVDGKEVAHPADKLRCNEIELDKVSRIRAFRLTTTVTVKKNRIWEDVTLTADQPTHVNLIYHFMHLWTETATAYIAELPDGTRVEGTFTGDRTQRIDKPTRWSAIYDGPSGKGVVTCMLDVPKDDDWRTRYWDVPGRYRKHYLATFLNKTVPANEAFHYRAVVIPFAAPATSWKETAAALAASAR